MPSILPGYEYDIYISYRQKDNRSDKWVTNFVQVLEEEIDAIFKEYISIYFDKNPHDGLLETHDVEQSLNEKVKCLIFIPIISQTYCDPDCFAWKKEFIPFRNFAKQDEFGLDIKLASGNVAKRILPVRIYDIEAADQQLFEEETGGVMRSVDFIYSEPGVNRPLRDDEENPSANLNQTFYRNQVNKVANAIKELLSGIKGNSKSESQQIPSIEPSVIEVKPKKKNRALFAAIAIAIILALGYFLYSTSGNDTIKVGSDHKSIAVLAFSDQSPNSDQEWLGDGVADEILNVLAKTKGLKVIGKTSSFSFKGTNATAKEIGEALDVKTVLEGSVSRVGDKLRIIAQLIDVETEAHIWSDKYDRDAEDIFAIIDEVAQNIAGSLMSELSVEEVENIKMAYQPNAEAYEYFMKGEQLHFNDLFSGALDKSSNIFEHAKEMFIKSMSTDPSYGEAVTGLASLYDSYKNLFPLSDWRRDYYIRKRDSVLSLAYQIDPNTPYVLMLKGFININLDSAFYFLAKAYQIDPNHLPTKLGIGNKLWAVGLYKECLVFCNKILITDPLNNLINIFVVNSLWYTGQIDEARELGKKLLEFDENNRAALLITISTLGDQDLPEAKRIYQEYISDSLEPSFIKAIILAFEGRTEEALKTPNYIIYSILNMKSEAIADMTHKMETKANPYVGDFSYLSLKDNPFFNNIRQEPQFQQWLEEAKVVHDERVRKYGNLFDD